jgi:hypothetical protein
LFLLVKGVAEFLVVGGYPEVPPLWDAAGRLPAVI